VSPPYPKTVLDDTAHGARRGPFVFPAGDFRPIPRERRRLLFATVVLTSLACLAGPWPLRASAPQRPNVVLITIDTTRADHLRCYGYTEIETPNIDTLARAGIRFSHAFSPVPITLPAHTVILTGAYPMATGMHDFSGNKLAAGFPTLASVLRSNGYATAAFIGSAVLDSRFGLNQGFDTYFDHFDFSRLDETNLDLMERRGDQVMDQALGWLKLNPPQPFLLWVHLYDPHYPYTPPQPFASRYASRPYDGEIAFADAQVGRLFAFLRNRGWYDGSVMALASDHGEGLSEHGEKTHGFFVYNSTLHVPLIFKIPGASPAVIHEEVSLADVMPTLLQALRLPPPATVQGRSLLSVMLGQPPARPSNLYSETYLPLLHFHWSQLRGYESRGLKYIDAPRPELYDLQTDPHELKNLYPTRQALAEGLHNELFSLLGRFTPATLPARRGGPAQAGKNGSTERELTDPGLLERLRSLGYVAVSAGNYSDASGKPLPDPKDRIQVYELVSEGMNEGQRGHYDESLAKLQQAAQVEPKSLPINYLMALDYYRKKDYARAVESFQEVTRIDPRFALGRYYLGLAYGEQSNFSEAAVQLNKALELDPTNFSAAFDLAAAYLKENRIDEAAAAFERSVAIYPDYAQGHEALGELYLYRKRADDAVRELERAVALAPGMRKAHYHLGQAYEAKGLKEKAQQQFEKARAAQ